MSCPAVYGGRNCTQNIAEVLGETYVVYSSVYICLTICLNLWVMYNVIRLLRTRETKQWSRSHSIYLLLIISCICLTINCADVNNWNNRLPRVVFYLVGNTLTGTIYSCFVLFCTGLLRSYYKMCNDFSETTGKRIFWGEVSALALHWFCCIFFSLGEGLLRPTYIWGTGKFLWLAIFSLIITIGCLLLCYYCRQALHDMYKISVEPRNSVSIELTTRDTQNSSLISTLCSATNQSTNYSTNNSPIPFVQIPMAMRNTHLKQQFQGIFRKAGISCCISITMVIVYITICITNVKSKYDDHTHGRSSELPNTFSDTLQRSYMDLGLFVACTIVVFLFPAKKS